MITIDIQNLVSPEAASAFTRTAAQWADAFQAADKDDVFTLATDMHLDPNLKEFERNSLIKLAAKRMGVTYRDLVKDLRQGSGEPKKDHLYFARQTLDFFEAGNVLYSQGGFWVWRDAGVWERVLDHEIRRAAVGMLQGQEAVTDGTVRSVVALAKDEAYSAAAHFDQPAPRRINVQNGTLHYQAGAWALRAHDRGDYLTTQLPMSFDPAATCPRFDRFLAEIFEGDADATDKAQVILEMIGYTLTQSCQFEKFILLVGSGSNGKSVLLDVLRSLVGSGQVASVEPGKLGDRVERERLHGKLANICPELPVGAMLADAALKSFTSGDLVSGAAKFGQPFDYKPYATFWTGTNHMPHTRDLSHGMFRRALIVQFNRTFNESTREIGLADKLRDELPGILVKALAAFASVIERGGFTVPASSDAALKAWRTDADQVAQFLEERCKRGAECGPISHAELFMRFRDWADSQGIKHSVTGKAFTARMEALGLPSDRYYVHGQRVRGFIGVELN